MCGVVGWIAARGWDDSKDAILKAMTDSLVHRGPDGEGQQVDRQRAVGLGHRRLSIRDLSEAGAQPMESACGRWLIAYNGELYNDDDFRDLLVDAGIKLRGHSDTEVLVNLLALEGPSIIPRLKGMFAFVALDREEQRVIVARDQMGRKPLWYARLDDGSWLFASEGKALFKHPGLSPRLEAQSLYDYLSFAVCPAPQTLFQGCFKVPAGTYGVLKLDDLNMRWQRYWSPGTAFAKPRHRLFDQEASEALLAALKTATERRMVSDVPFGAYLSGGIDSSTNVALMAQALDRPVDTFSVAVEGPAEADEREPARRVAATLSARHHELLLDADAFMDRIDGVLAAQDEPLADSVCVPLLALAHFNRQAGVTVVQVGEGADELLFGYPLYRRFAQAMPFWRRLQVPFGFIPIPKIADHPLVEALQYRWQAGQPAFWGGNIGLTTPQKHALLRPEYQSRPSGEVIRQIIREEGVERGSAHEQILAVELRLRLPELLLQRVDRMTMDASVEARVPFLDEDVVDLCLRLPLSKKMRAGKGKWILRKAVTGLIPDFVLERKKVGFCGSARTMLQQRTRARMSEQLASSRLLKEILTKEGHQQLQRDALEASDRENPGLWTLYNLAQWGDRWL
ncbi:MAG: asparagine synthase (glutamine-hydrolyzing) [Myxococcales bacterium]|nr:asparagine synthase (glutamine-hydrolyzing) [Myxococcales bacterium]